MITKSSITTTSGVIVSTTTLTTPKCLNLPSTGESSVLPLTASNPIVLNSNDNEHDTRILTDDGGRRSTSRNTAFQLSLINKCSSISKNTDDSSNDYRKPCEINQQLCTDLSNDNIHIGHQNGYDNFNVNSCISANSTCNTSTPTKTSNSSIGKSFEDKPNKQNKSNQFNSFSTCLNYHITNVYDKNYPQLDSSSSSSAPPPQPPPPPLPLLPATLTSSSAPIAAPSSANQHIQQKSNKKPIRKPNQYAQQTPSSNKLIDYIIYTTPKSAKNRKTISQQQQQQQQQQPNKLQNNVTSPKIVTSQSLNFDGINTNKKNDTFISDFNIGNNKNIQIRNEIKTISTNNNQLPENSCKNYNNTIIKTVEPQINNTNNNNNNHNNNTINTNNDCTNNNKQRKRRVVPTLVNKNTNKNHFSSPIFRNDNNILNITNEEEISHTVLRNEREKISQNFRDEKLPENQRVLLLENKLSVTAENQPTSSIVSGQLPPSRPESALLARIEIPVSSNECKELNEIPLTPSLKQHPEETITIDLTKVFHKTILNQFIKIYSIIIDLNLIINVLTEISFLLNLLNCEPNKKLMKGIGNKEVTSPIDETQSTASLNVKTDINNIDNNRKKIKIKNIENLLKNFNNCIYFVLGVLNKQKCLLALLDTITIKVLIENERLIGCQSIKEFLTKIYLHKLELESLKFNQHEISFKPIKLKYIQQQNDNDNGNGTDDDNRRDLIQHSTPNKAATETGIIPLSSSSSPFNNVMNTSAGCNGNVINVFYQPEEDTKNNFPSENEFMGFKKQRDLFYSILRIWESKHLNPLWNFTLGLGNKIRSLLLTMEHPINMEHLAKLFTSQLILSCNSDDTSQELQLAVPNVDLTKLLKLQQRFVTPSNFSTDYLYPGNQIFFKEFIMATAKHTMFLEQLKIILLNELLELNNSSYEIIHLSSKSNTTNHQDMIYLNDNHGQQKPSPPRQQYNEYVVRSETIYIMKVLAKFLGFIIAIPYRYESNYNNNYTNNNDNISNTKKNSRNVTVDTRQIELRNMLPPPFELKPILIKSINQHKLLITIPWIVQYLSMLDYITLRLRYYIEILYMLYELYILLNCQTSCFCGMRPTSIFILRTSLGWLFEQTNVPDEYYNYRYNRMELIDTDIMNKTNLMSTSMVKKDKDLDGEKHTTEYFHQISKQLMNSDHPQPNHDNEHSPINDNEKLKNPIENQELNSKNLPNDDIIMENIFNENDIKNKTTLNDIIFAMDPLLEKILHTACPFLADFRVSIMPTRLSKTVSRTGRYRHIITKQITTNQNLQHQNNADNPVNSMDSNGMISIQQSKSEQHQHQQQSQYHNESLEQSLSLKNANENQIKLIDHFLQTQNLSVRRTVEFIIERVTSATIKDFQMEMLVPAKRKCAETILKITKTDETQIQNQIMNLYTCSELMLRKQWDENILNMIRERVKKSFDALLPNETIPEVKLTCYNLAISKCKLKTNEWYKTYITESDIFTKEIHSDIEKVKSNNKKLKSSNEILIDLTKVCPSDIFGQLHLLLHFASLEWYKLNSNGITIFVNDLIECVKHQILPKSMYKAIAFSSVKLVLLIVRNRPDLITNEFLDKFCEIWKLEQLNSFSILLSVVDESEQTSPTSISPPSRSESPSELSTTSNNISSNNTNNNTQENDNDLDGSGSNCFSNIINPRYILTFDTNSTIQLTFDALTKFLVKLLNKKLITVKQLIDQCVTLFRDEWPTIILQGLSKLMDDILQNTQIDSNVQDVYFLEMLSELTRNIEID